MKMAALFAESRMQLVLTPEGEQEIALCRLLGHDTRTLKVQAYRGGFYRCAGGWDRLETEDSSIIVTVEKV